MAILYPKAYVGDGVIPIEQAQLSIASAAVLYGLSVYTVFQVTPSGNGEFLAFRLPEHYARLVDSTRIMGIDTFEKQWNFQRFEQAVRELLQAQSITDECFVRATIHVDALLPGTRSRGLSTKLTMFACSAESILPSEGCRLKSSVWRRVPDYSIPSRAKVNGAYVNSVLAKQDALDSGYDDCIFLDAHGHVCELSAANIFMVRDGVLITPDNTHDLLEGINRRTILTLAKDLGIKTRERTIDLTELYVADEVFACGTSAFLTSIHEIDGRMIGDGGAGPITQSLQEIHSKVIRGQVEDYQHWITKLQTM